MDSAWVAGAFGLIGSLIGALATLAGIRMTNLHANRTQAETLHRERVAVLHAYASELELIGQLAAARAEVMRMQSEKGAALQTSLLRTEVIGKPFFLSRMSEQVGLIPPKLAEELTTAYVMCETTDGGVLRWVEHEEQIRPASLLTLANLMSGAANRCAGAAAAVRAWLAENHAA